MLRSGVPPHIGQSPPLDLLSAQEVLQSAGLGLIDAQVEQALARWRVLYFSAAFGPTLGLIDSAAAARASP